MTNTDKLTQLITQRGLKLQYVADYLNINRFTLQKKINNQTEFKISEVGALCDLLGIKADDVQDIFFSGL